MRHHRQTQQRLGRNVAERKALFKNLVSSLLNYQQITTTLPKAKAAKRMADRVITLGKTDTLSSRRRVFTVLQDHDLTSRVFKDVAPRFKARKGGYTRILQLGRRKGDGAQLALLELTEKEIKIKEVKKTKTKEAPEEKAHKHEAREERPKPMSALPEKKAEKPKAGFLGNLGKFLRNKGFGNKGA